MQNKVGFTSILLASVLGLSSCEDSLTNIDQPSSPTAVDLSVASATVNQNNIGLIAKAMTKSINQINPALSSDVYPISFSQRNARMQDCAYTGQEVSEITQHDAYSYSYDLEFLECQNDSHKDRLIGHLIANVVLKQSDNFEQYSVDLTSEIKQTDQLGITSVSQLNSFIEVATQSSTQSFELKMLLDGQGSFFVKSVSLLQQDNQTGIWTGGHLILTTATEEIDVYIEKNQGLYFEYQDGTTLVVSFDEIH